VFIGCLWLVLCYRWVLKKEPGPRSQEFYLAMATIGLAISCAIPLGRNAYTDPLSVRYQTVTMVYWLSISCLLLCRAQGLDDQRGIRRALILLAFVPVLPLFGAFGFTMPDVAAMSNSATVTQILGRMGINAFAGKADARSRAFAAYFADHQVFMESYSFKPLEMDTDSRARLPVIQARCEGFWLQQADSGWPGVREIRVRPEGISANPFLTRLDLRGNNGEPGRLFAAVPRKGGLREVFFDERIWRGFYRGDVAESSPVTLYVDPVIGRRYQCILAGKQR